MILKWCNCCYYAIVTYIPDIMYFSVSLYWTPVKTSGSSPGARLVIYYCSYYCCF